MLETEAQTAFPHAGSGLSVKEAWPRYLNMHTTGLNSTDTEACYTLTYSSMYSGGVASNFISWCAGIGTHLERRQDGFSLTGTFNKGGYIYV